MSDEAPLISVVIPTYNRPEPLRACLESLTRLRAPAGGFEVVVVDDGSDPPLAPVVEAKADRLPARLIRQANAGPAAARNAGVEAAAGRYIAFTDDDCAPDPDWLCVLADRLNQHPGALIGGRIVNALPQNLGATASQHLIGYLYGYYNDGPAARFLTSNNMAVSRRAFQEAGGFDTNLRRAAAEDRELSDRWVHQGRPCRYEPDAIIHHAHRMTLRQYWRQHFSYGRGAWYYHQVRGRRVSEGVRKEPLRFYLDLITYPFGREPLRRALPLAVLMFLSQAANALGYFWERWVGRHDFDASDEPALSADEARGVEGQRA
jgi:GT2 family glycosyltransferase